MFPSLFTAFTCLVSVSALNKCCESNEHLQVDFTCVKAAPLKWPPEDLIYHKPLITEYGVNQPCNGTDLEVVQIDEDLEILSNGQLFIRTSLGNSSFPLSSYCVDTIRLKQGGEYHVALLCPCQHATCVRKCCHDGMLLEFEGDPEKSRAKCAFHDDEDWVPPITSIYPGTNYFLKHGYPTCKPGRKMYLLRKSIEEEPLNFWFLDDGRVQVKGSKKPIMSSEYCGDLTRINGEVIPNLLPCPFESSNGPESMVQVFYGVLYTIGAIFLGLTLMVQLALPELRKSVHASSLTAHVGVMLVGYILLAAGSFRQGTISRVLCTATASGVQFTFLAAFFWLNVMCVDISWTFSGYRSPQARSAVESERRKFLYYSLYAWGTSLVITAVTLIVDLVPGAHPYFKANFGRTLCWFEDRIPTLIFFYLPVAITLILNLLLFAYTSYKILKMRQETSVLSRNESARHEGNKARKADEHRFLLYLKLFSLMGITWVFEIISWLNNKRRDNWLWYIPDTVNALRGVFIFLIFCCKQKTMKLLKSRVLNSFRSKNHSRSSNARRSGQSSSTFTTVNVSSVQQSSLRA